MGAGGGEYFPELGEGLSLIRTDMYTVNLTLFLNYC